MSQEEHLDLVLSELMEEAASSTERTAGAILAVR